MNKKITLIFLCAAMFIICLAACGGSVRDDVAVSQICTEIEGSVGSAIDMVEAPDSYIVGTIKLNGDDYADCCVKINSRGINVDEYGVFKGSDKTQTDSIKAALEAYLQLREDTWMPEYMPEEFPKVQNAEIKVVGNYVMYTIFSDETRAAANTALEDALK